jgi:hypothetical protein
VVHAEEDGVKHSTRPDPPAPLFDFSGPGGPEKQAPKPKPFVIDAAAARRERDEAIERTARSAESSWYIAAMEAVAECARTLPEFIVDDVQALLSAKGIAPPSEGRRMGAVMVDARTRGLIEATDRYRPSAQAHCHANPRKVWLSRVYQNSAA